MIYLVLFLAAICAFCSGYILGVTNPFHKGKAVEKITTQHFGDGNINEEITNFLKYDGTEQI